MLSIVGKIEIGVARTETLNGMSVALNSCTLSGAKFSRPMRQEGQ